MERLAISTDAGFGVKKSYVWDAPGKPVSIEIDFDVVDRLDKEFQRGVGAAPKRGLEVGGILLGTLGSGDKLSVTIEDFEPIPCSYQQGPSYIIDDPERAAFEQALLRWKPSAGRRVQAVGFYRSHTRDGLCLDRRDRELVSRYFPGDDGIVLLVKPYATRAGKAGFFFKEGGQIRDDLSAREFPFRRDELGGGQKARQAVEDTVNGNAMTQNPVTGGGGLNRSLFSQSEATPGGGEAQVPPAPASANESAVPKRTLRLRGGWVWVPASFVFLLVGTIIGFQVALSVHTKVTQPPDPYNLNLSATPSADSIHLRWDRTSPAIQLAQKGTLVILEDGQQKNVDLDAGHLRNGSVIYRRASDQVSFRLEVFTNDRVSLSETVDFSPVTPTAQE